MSVTRKTYVEFTVPGLLFTGTETAKVKDRNIQNLKIPRTAFALRFFDILVTEISNGKNKVKAESEPVKYSRFYNIGTRICTKEEVAKETKGEKLSKDAREGRSKMLRQMEVDKLKYALRCQVGGFVSLKKRELVILLEGDNKSVTKVQ